MVAQKLGKRLYKMPTNLEGAQSPLAMSLLQEAVNTIFVVNFKKPFSNRGSFVGGERRLSFHFESWE